MNEARRVVYLCATPIHLLNCIVAQVTVFKGIPADIVFEDVSDFSVLSKNLKKYSVFENIYHFSFLKGKEKYMTLPAGEERHRVDRKPSLTFDLPPLPYEYTDLCVNIDSYAPKFFYYGLLEMGMHPKIHFVSEGTGTYSLDFSNTDRDNMDHRYYKERAFRNNVENLYCYRPDLYTGGVEGIRLAIMPNIQELPEQAHEIITGVFGQADPIQEKLIFFEGTFWGDGMLTNELHLLLAIAEHIGKENLIIKRHPRNTVDRFTPLGFKVMPKQSIPWEVMIKDLDLSRKVLVSVASFSSFSALEMYGKPSLSLLLKNLMQGRVYFLEDPGYRRFFNRAERIYNAEQTTSWSPRTLCEIKRTLDVLEKRVGGWKA